MGEGETTNTKIMDIKLIHKRGIRIIVLGTIVLVFLVAGSSVAYAGTNNVYLSILTGVFSTLTSFVAILAWRIHRRIGMMWRLLTTLKSSISKQDQSLTGQANQISKIGSVIGLVSGKVGTIEQQIHMFEIIVSNSTLELNHTVEIMERTLTDSINPESVVTLV